MGMRKKSSGCISSSCKTIIKEVILGNPNPSNFKILSAGMNENFTILKVKYPDCANYEGVKILVYKGHILKELMAMTEVDPHFCDKHLSPIARFEPTEYGLKLALSLKE